MSKRIKRDDYLYREAISWMSHRYAIGITEFIGRSGESEAERYRMFRDIEYDTEDFHALVNAFTDFLKRKKITDIVQLGDKYRESDLIWLSRNYAMGIMHKTRATASPLPALPSAQADWDTSYENQLQP